MSQTTPPQQPPPATPQNEPLAPRPARSKNGCNACRRRKVRCNERRPRCGHCERLNLECTWNRVPSQRNNSTATTTTQLSIPISPHTATSPFSTGPAPLNSFAMTGNTFFDFSAPFGTGTWDEAMLLSPNSWPSDLAIGGAEMGLVPPSIHPTRFRATSRDLQMPSTRHSGGFSSMPERHHPDPASTSPLSTEGDPNVSVDGDFLLETFLEMLMPPILTPVEIGPKWASTRDFFRTMASDSAIVRSAIMAFTAMQMQHNGLAKEHGVADWRPLYDHAARQLANALTKRAKGGQEIGEDLKHILTALFLLTYTDLLTETLPRAHANLREAFNLIQAENKEPSISFTAPEKRLISWLRLIDARAVSTAGGEGLFLSGSDDSWFEASPAATNPTLNQPQSQDTEIEEILFDVLYHPGLVFYQKVQSFVGRITRIDRWHRSRGTVQDETEVMALASQISKDLHKLYDQRPPLMDPAVAGNLTEKYLAKNLAAALTRSFRTYLANYYASFVHLHRVAYVQWPKTKDIDSAIENIKSLSHSMADTGEALPVNLLWPLLMWGCEEESHEERQWILDAIRSLESIATNAKATAQLLEEVQRRQDLEDRRVDVRGVSQEYFGQKNHFAIV